MINWVTSAVSIFDHQTFFGVVHTIMGNDLENAIFNVTHQKEFVGGAA